MGLRIQHEEHVDGPARCLGHPPHVVQMGECICHSCGTLTQGAQLGMYTVQQLLGYGRSGNAYLATHTRSQQTVVVKLIPPEPDNLEIWEAARREVRIATSLRHPSILPIYSCSLWHPNERPGTSRSVHDYATAKERRELYLLTLCQYVPGTLAQFITYYERNDGKANSDYHMSMLTRLIGLIQQIGSALSAAHARGIVHGALLPGNVLLNGQDRLWVADFGLARLYPPPPPYLAPELAIASQVSTQTGKIKEFWEAATPASDQYTFAILCEQLFTRLLPAAEYEPALPIIQCATHQKPSRRFASVDIFVTELIAQLTQGNTVPMSPFSHGYLPSRRSTGPISQPLHPSIPAQEIEQYERTRNYQLVAPSHPIPISQPIAVDDWERRGDKLFTLRDYEGAINAYQRAIERNAGKAATWLALGDAYFAIEDYVQALKAYEQSLARDPNDAQTWLNRGAVLDALNRHKEAMDCYERAEQLR